MEESPPKKFVVPGDGLDDLDSAFEAALTYQPSVPLTDEDIEVYDKTLVPSGTMKLLTDTFSIDDTLGRDVTVKLSIPQTDVTKTVDFAFIQQNGTVFRKRLTTRTTLVHFDRLEVYSSRDN